MKKLLTATLLSLSFTASAGVIFGDGIVEITELNAIISTQVAVSPDKTLAVTHARINNTDYTIGIKYQDCIDGNGLAAVVEIGSPDIDMIPWNVTDADAIKYTAAIACASGFNIDISELLTK